MPSVTGKEWDNREVKLYVYGKRQTVESCVSQKRENLRFLTCVTLEKLFDISS